MADIFFRSKLNPILKPDNPAWLKVYNPGAAISDDGQIHLFPRVVGDNGRSSIAHAVSRDGENFVFDSNVAVNPRGRFESRGVEDARVTRIGDIYHIVFAGFDGTDVELKTAISQDLNGPWIRKGPAVPNFQFIASGGVRVRWEHKKPFEKRNPKGRDHRSKSGALFPRKIGDRYFLMFGEFRMWLATSLDGIRFDVIPGPFLHPRKNSPHFDNVFVEMGPPPIETERGWLVLYHGVNEHFQYQLGFLILDRNDPTRILYRSSEPILSPREPYEVAPGPIDVLPGAFEVAKSRNSSALEQFYQQVSVDNLVPEVIFCTGAILLKEMLQLYYGAADSVICTASAPLTEVLKRIG